MEQKRRNSILKKPPPIEDETTGELTTKIKRRISFSGKKSVKEFIAGEEEATIWGTSYEESADGLQANSTERNLVNVNEKRIVLRNRRVVVVEPKSDTKRRSKRKVTIAENDKENVFVQQPQVELAIEQMTVAQVEPVPKVESPVKSEMALVKCKFEDAKTLTMSESLDRLNICSSTFDFINYSGQINKSITIEQSVDVTLNENELQMYKFRVPVSATDVSPNLSLSSLRDGSSPNIFSRSILISEAEMNMLRMLRGKDVNTFIGTQITEITTKKNVEDIMKTTNDVQMELGQTVKNNDHVLTQLTSVQETDIKVKFDEPNMPFTMPIDQSMSVSQCDEMNNIKPNDMELESVKSNSDCTLKNGLMNLVSLNKTETEGKKRATMHMNQTMNVSRCEGAEIKNLKRKTATKDMNVEESRIRMDNTMKTHLISIDTSSMDISSPIRKKPMRNVTTSKPMDITYMTVNSNSKLGPSRRKTIQFESADVEESFISNTAGNEFQNTINDSMEQSIAAPKSSRKTIHFDHHLMEIDSVCQNINTSFPAVVVEKSNSMGLCANALTKSESTTKNRLNLMTMTDKDSKLDLDKRDSVQEYRREKDAKVKNSSKDRRTIHFVEDGEMDLTLDISKDRQSIPAYADICEDSPKCREAFYHQTIITNADMIQDSPKPTKHIQASESNGIICQTIDDSIDAIQQVVPFNQHTVFKKRESIYTPTDIIEDSPRQTKPTETENDFRVSLSLPNSEGAASKFSVKQRTSICRPEDIIEVSPKVEKAIHRQTIYSSADIIEDVPPPVQHFAIKVNKRESIYTPTDIIVDSARGIRSPEHTIDNKTHDFTKASLPSNLDLKNSLTQHQSIHTLSATDVDSPKVQRPQINQPATSVHKVIVKHLNLHQGLLRDQAAFRILNNQQATIKPQIEAKTDDSFMDISVHDEESKPSKKNFYQLNEEMLRGDTKAFSGERKQKISLFDSLEKKSADEIKFDSFMDKSNAIGCVVQPARNSMKDYTMDLMASQKERENEYNMDLLLDKTAKQYKTISYGQKTMEIPSESINPLRNQVFSRSNESAVVDIQEKLRSSSSEHSKIEQSKRQTIHFNKEIDLDMSTNPPLPEIKKQTIHPKTDFDSKNHLPQEDSMDLSKDNVPAFSRNKCKRQTINLNESLEAECLDPQFTQLSQNLIVNKKFAEESQLAKQTPLTIARDTLLGNDELTMDLQMQKVHGGSKSLYWDMNCVQSKQEHEFAIRCTVFPDRNLEPEKLNLGKPVHLNTSQTVSKNNNQQDDDTMDVSMIVSHSSLSLSKPQTIQTRYVMDLEENKTANTTSQIESQPRRQTIHCNEDLELDNINSVQQSIPQISKIPKRQTIHFNNDLEVEDITNEQALPKSVRTIKRQTIHFNQDLEIEDTNEQPDQQSKASLQKQHFKQEREVKDSNEKHVASRYTLHFNEDIELEKEDARQMALFNETKRNTAENGSRNPMNENSKFVFKSMRRTIHFHENNALDESVQASHNEFRTNLQEEAVKPLPKPKRLTNVVEQPVDIDESPQKFTACKSSFSRTLNFDEIQTVSNKSHSQSKVDMEVPNQQLTSRQIPLTDEDSPLYNLNTKSKGVEVTAEIDRSLAEYLKAETAATLSQSNSLEAGMKVIESGQTAYCSERDEVMEENRSKSGPQRLGEPVNMFEESGMQLIQKSAFRRQTTFSSEDMLDDTTNREPGTSIRLEKKDNVAGIDVQTEQTCLQSTSNFAGDKIAMISVAMAKRSDHTDKFMRQKFLDPPAMEMEKIQNLHTFHSQDKTSGENVAITMDIVDPTRLNIQSNRCSRQTEDMLQNKRHTFIKPIPMMEECENSMETSNFSEESPKLFETNKVVSRKTIHFTNENAVDESFFDENPSYSATSKNQKNSQTLFFNETNNPVSNMEVTLSPNKSTSMRNCKEVQNMKKILFENNLLFTKSKLLEPSTFENKRSTIYFAHKDNSMDVTTVDEITECVRPNGNAISECTPTKYKLSKSRIPQLIDSAKKIQSMKRSMKFIQEELPNIGCRIQKDDIAENETTSLRVNKTLDTVGSPRQVSAPNELYEFLNTVETPQRVTDFVPKLLQESFDTVEIPRKVTTHEPRQLQESFDTVEIPRRATTFQKNDTLHLCPNDMEATNVSQKSFFKFEDAPITISDVSTFFAQKLLPTCKQTNDTYSPNTTEALCNLDVNRFAVDNQSSDSEDTAHNFDKFKKRYVELTCDSIASPGISDDIEKTHLSLVNTLDEEIDVVHNDKCPEEFTTKIPPQPEPTKTNSSVCRNCKRHRLSVTQNDTTIGSFLLEPLPEYKINLAALQELSTKPKISDVAKIWLQKMRDSDSFNTTDGSRIIALDDSDSVDSFIAAMDNERLVTAQQRQHKEIERKVSFVNIIRKKMHSKPSNWILNELLLSGNILKFTHTRIRTFAILIRFTPKDPMGIEVIFNEVQLVTNVLHTRQWTPFDYALHYQLFVELPFDLRKLCPTSENLFQLLEHVEEVTQDVLKTGKDMLYLVLTSPASLMRGSSGSLYIRKIALSKSPQNEVKRTEFQIEVRNIKKLSYECIAVPPLYEFDEKIQLLPVGQEFLRIFLADPMRYMKA